MQIQCIKAFYYTLTFMELFTNRKFQKRPKYYIFLFGFFLLINSGKALKSEDNSYLRKIQNTNNFEQVFFQNSITYDEYDSINGQLKSFFGLKADPSKASFYPDLNIISNSSSLRRIYKLKLNDMIIDKPIYKLKK